MINQSNTLFVFISSVLVFFMTPGLAFFYGGDGFKEKCSEHDDLSIYDYRTSNCLIYRFWL